MDNDLLTTKEAANLLGIKRGTFQHYVHTGLIEPIEHKESRHHLHYFQRYSIEKFKEKPAFVSNIGTTTRRSLYRSNTYKHKVPQEDQVFPDGCIIYWTQRFRENGSTFVPMKCKGCGKIVKRYSHHLFTPMKKGVFSGCCQICAPRYKKITALRRRFVVLPDGYIKRHIRSFFPKDQEVLLPMVPKRGYIFEHRAVMALYLGRPLRPSEVVHHINGNKGDNSIDNLVICPVGTHNDIHTEILRKLSQLMKRVKELEEENQFLKNRR